MIKFDNKIIETWNKKIVFAPNGMGKTTTCVKIERSLKKEGHNTKIFTRRTIQNLISLNNGSIHFGTNAMKQTQNDKIIENNSKKPLLSSYAKDIYKASSVKALKLNSIYFSQCSFTNFKSIESLTEPIERVYEYEDNGVCMDFETAVIIDKEKRLLPLFTRVNELLNLAHPKDKITRHYKYEISEEDLDILYDFLEDVKMTGKRYCPLCGSTKSTNELLVKKIEKHLSRYRIKSGSTLLDDWKSAYRDLKTYMIKTKIDYLKENLSFVDTPNVADMAQVFKTFTNIIVSSMYAIKNNYENYSVGEETISSLYSTFVNNKTDIENEKKLLLKKHSLVPDIIREFNRIVILPDNIKLKHIEGSLTFALNIDGEDQKDPYSILSESEFKRLALAVLRVLVNNKLCDTLILDDPIDSYDDYYFNIACDYIHKILSSKELTNWYFTTNNTKVLYNFCNIKKIKYLIYSEDPDMVFIDANKRSNLISFEANGSDISLISNNEITILQSFVSKKLVTNESKLLFLSFLTTLRNIKDLVLRKPSKIIVGNRLNKETIDFIENRIEHLYMHYEPNLLKTSYKGSDELTYKDLYPIYSNIFNIENNNLLKLSNKNEPIIYDRTCIVSQPFDITKPNAILRLVLLKILMISHLKFELERILIDGFISNGVLNKNEINSVVETHSLGKKIKKAKEVLKNNPDLKSSEIYNKVNYIYNENKLMFNDFDHGLNRMFPPYLATSFRDILRFKEAIYALKEKSNNESN